MAIDVANEDLRGAVGAADGAADFDAFFCEVILSGLEVVRAEGEVIAAIVGDDGLVAFADEVQAANFGPGGTGPSQSLERPASRL